jgi:hypothetical protein
MIEAELELIGFRIASMYSKRAALGIPDTSTAGPSFRPQTLLASEFELAWMMQTNLLVIPIVCIILVAPPILAFHFSVRQSCVSLHRWLLHHVIRYFAWVSMRLFPWRRQHNEVPLLELLVYGHLLRISIDNR